MKTLNAVMTALITPFKSGEVDWKSLENLVKRQLEAGVEGFIALGTTAESPTLRIEERKKIFELIKGIVSKQVPVVLGTGTNCTAETVKMTLEAKNWGADAALVVVPYYNKPPQRGLLAHFKEVAVRSDFPILLYNVPGRTVVSLAPETVAQLAEIPQIKGIKEASGSIELLKKMKAITPNEFIFLSGDDGTFVDFLCEGGTGIISVTSHVFPQQMLRWRQWVKKSEFAKAKEDFKKYQVLTDKLFIEPNPIPVKKALQFMGIIESAELRLPLCEMESELSLELKTEMLKANILESK